MNIKPIKNKKDHLEALSEIEKLWDARKNTTEYDRLDILITLVDAYETKHYPIDDPDPIEALKSVMDDRNMKSVDLGNLIGGRSRATEILSRKRKLTLEMIRKINQNLGIPTDILVKEYKIKSSKTGRKRTPTVA
ncbi:Transcription regulator [Leptospira biflexa serovar Patoc strain 'Patoc 1 (Ames)']|uniref:Putative DNA-binding protein n=1 Tax=Leptospira biflexa serovar Patoc (strain Patoc 1 / ATCC 23582 / Paris) TaxID=456481 RepID=B0STS5_LEPBP|nr:DNA-binding protein [Leptospira biflexa]ABZ95895.1 Transcription regulator [Leptospira biflexa serovar Patoc strain 'Patoc 1 (Ames)']ABZ99609.1 Putative DNA-binding protein [Leptospira biflexa serovar Patoc strain 'Patoc 1 (Paris)']